MSVPEPDFTSPFHDLDTALRCLKSSMQKGREVEEDSSAAVQQFGHCLIHLSEYFSDALQREFSGQIDDPNFQRDAERAFAVLNYCHGFLGAMAGELQLAFAGLQIGEVRRSVRPCSRQGGTSTLDGLVLKSVLVAAADILRERGGGFAAYEAELAQRGLNSRSIEGYRRQIRRTRTSSLPVKFGNDQSIDGWIEWAKKRLKEQ